MKKLIILRDKLDLAEAYPSVPVILVGRSPFCDVVLRAPGVNSVQFVLEWVGEGDFNPESGFWIVSAPIEGFAPFESEAAETVHGHGRKIGPEGCEYEGFFFRWVEDSLSRDAFRRGMLKRDLEADGGRGGKSSGGGYLLEVIRLSSEREAVASIEYVSPRNVRHSPFFSGSLGAKISWRESTAVLTWDESRAKVTSMGGQLEKSSKEMESGSLLRLTSDSQNYYLRLVPRLLVPKAPPEAERDAFLPFATIFGLVLAVAAGLFFAFTSTPPPPEIESQLRIAKVEIQEAAKNPPPVEEPEEPAEAPEKVEQARQNKAAPAAAGEKPKVVTSPPRPSKAAKAAPSNAPPAPPPSPAAPEQAEKLEAKAKSEAVASGTASRLAKTSANSTANAGLNSPAPAKDVNSIGLLGSFKKSGQNPANQVSANMLLNNGVVSQSVSGADAKIVLKQSPSGVVGAQTTKEPNSGDSGKNDLLSASTTVSGKKAFDVNSTGPIAREDGLAGMNVGSGDTKSDAPTSAGAAKDFKSVGLLGSSDANNRANVQTVSADKIVQNGVAGGTGNTAGAKVVLNQSPGVVGAGSQPSGSSGKVGKGSLLKASSGVSSGNAFDVGENGPVARNGGMSGFDTGEGGTGTSSGRESRGNGDFGESVLGGLDRETVRRAIAAHRHAIRDCYNKELETHVNLTGTETFKWYISPKGQVTSARTAATDMNSPRLENCVLGIIRHIVFPKSPNGEPTTVIYPFLFKE